MSDKFEVKINCVVLTTNISLGKKYVLSLDKDKLTIPSFNVINDHLSDNKLNDKIILSLKEYVFVSDLELLPQIISLHSNHIVSDTQTLNTIYGFLINYTTSLNNCYWIEFDYSQPVEYMPLLIEVIQKLK
jgi:hypothetical protein